MPTTNAVEHLPYTGLLSGKNPLIVIGPFNNETRWVWDATYKGDGSEHSNVHVKLSLTFPFFAKKAWEVEEQANNSIDWVASNFYPDIGQRTILLAPSQQVAVTFETTESAFTVQVMKLVVWKLS